MVEASRHVQVDNDTCGRDTGGTVPEKHLHNAIEEEIAGCFEFQKAGRLSGMGNIDLDRT
jgi:hypothetical protein